MCHAKPQEERLVTHFSLNRTQMTRTRIISPTRFPSLKSQRCGSGGDASFMEQLLLHCATAIDSNDAALVHQLLWVLNNIASPDGDSSTQRLTSAFVRALLSRAVSKIPTLFSTFGNTVFQPPADEIHRFSVVELAGFIDRDNTKGVVWWTGKTDRPIPKPKPVEPAGTGVAPAVMKELADTDVPF